MLKFCFGLFLLLFSFRLAAQQDSVVMRINGRTVSRSEFLQAYNWCSDQNTHTGKRALKDFVRQYVDCRLKVAVAEAAGMDTTGGFKLKMDSIRRKLASVYLEGQPMEDSVARVFYKELARKQGERILVSHIFRRLPQNATAASLQRTEQLMDSIYEELQKRSDSFREFVERYSDEKDSLWVSKLQMPSEFESVVWQLKPGEVSSPFYTPQGIHIVKVLEKGEIPPFTEIKNRLLQTDYCRIGLRQSVAEVVERIQKECHFELNEAGSRELLSQGKTAKVLFSLAGRKYDGTDFARFAKAYPAGIKQQWNAFVQKTVLDCGYVGLEQDHAEFRIKVQAFRDTLLCRAALDRAMEARGGLDEAGLKRYFAEHRSDYDWEKPRYRGIVLHCVSKRVGKRVRKFLKQIPEEEWLDALHTSVNTETDVQVQAEYGLFVLGENAFVDEKIFRTGKATPDDSFPVVMLLGEKVKGSVDFREAGEKLMNDYQHYLETCWVNELRAKSKVEINQEVLKTVNNH